MALQVGQVAPEIELPDQDGKVRKLSDYLGKWVLVYFYPEDFTGGCTTEACEMRDRFPDFGKLDAVVLGISPDPVEKHKKFSEEYKLPFTLLSDIGKKALGEYGAWGEKNVYGKTVVGVIRSSFLIDPQGKIAKIYAHVKPEGHAEAVVADLQGLRK